MFRPLTGNHPVVHTTDVQSEDVHPTDVQLDDGQLEAETCSLLALTIVCFIYIYIYI
jgi:hypothetical protein